MSFELDSEFDEEPVKRNQDQVHMRPCQGRTIQGRYETELKEWRIISISTSDTLDPEFCNVVSQLEETEPSPDSEPGP